MAEIGSSEIKESFKRTVLFTSYLSLTAEQTDKGAHPGLASILGPGLVMYLLDCRVFFILFTGMFQAQWCQVWRLEFAQKSIGQKLPLWDKIWDIGFRLLLLSYFPGGGIHIPACFKFLLCPICCSFQNAAPELEN
eukprot:1161722-Pelagomonas_calceolata.AAC.7